MKKISCKPAEARGPGILLLRLCQPVCLLENNKGSLNLATLGGPLKDGKIKRIVNQ